MAIRFTKAPDADEPKPPSGLRLRPQDIKDASAIRHQAAVSDGRSPDGVALTSVAHPKGPGLKRGRPTNERRAAAKAAIEEIEIELPNRAEEPKFDRVAYQKTYMKEYMRAYRRNKKGDTK